MQKTVLCVEDNPVNLEILSAMLERLNFNVISAENGNDAINLIQEHLPDVILMDLHLPDIDGIEATRIIKSQNISSNIPVIAVTADTYAKQPFLDAGGDLYLQKPIRIKALERIIDEAFQLE